MSPLAQTHRRLPTMSQCEPAGLAGPCPPRWPLSSFSLSSGHAHCGFLTFTWCLLLRCHSAQMSLPRRKPLSLLKLTLPPLLSHTGNTYPALFWPHITHHHQKWNNLFTVYSNRRLVPWGLAFVYLVTHSVYPQDLESACHLVYAKYLLKEWTNNNRNNTTYFLQLSTYYGLWIISLILTVLWSSIQLLPRFTNGDLKLNKATLLTYPRSDIE